MNSSGPFSLKTPRSTNPGIFRLPDRQPIDDIIDPQSLDSSTMWAFRNTPFVISDAMMRDLAEHSNFHVRNKSFGTGPKADLELLQHQELMYQGILGGLSFLKAHEFALRNGPKPIN